MLNIGKQTMQHINPNKSKLGYKKIAIIISVIVALAVIGIGGWTWAQLHKNSPATNGSINYNKPTTDQQSTTSNTTEQVQATDASKTTGTTGTDQPAAPAATTGGTVKTVSVTITSANQSDTTLQVRSLIGAVVNTGSCTLTLSNGSRTGTKKSGVQPTANSSTCQGFNVPVSELSSGTWSMMISFTDSNLSGSSATQKVVIQ